MMPGQKPALRAAVVLLLEAQGVIEAVLKGTEDGEERDLLRLAYMTADNLVKSLRMLD